MAEVKWIKLTTDMFDNRKIKHLRRLPEGNSIVLIWVMLLTMAGRCNASGMIFLTENIPYTPKMLADELDFEENTVVLALRALEDLNMVVTNRGYFAIAGWEEYQNIEGMDKIRESKRLAQARWRAKQKELPDAQDVDSTVDSTRYLVDDAEEDKDIDKDKDKDKDKEDIYPFDEFWSAYPKKKAKEAAKKAWVKLKPDETLGKTIIAAVLGSANTTDWKKENGKYIPYPATYLNGKRWEDERNDDNGQDTRNTQKVQYGTVI
jgi:predicted phage replisome organizer